MTGVDELSDVTANERERLRLVEVALEKFRARIERAAMSLRQIVKHGNLVLLVDRGDRSRGRGW